MTPTRGAAMAALLIAASLLLPAVASAGTLKFDGQRLTFAATAGD